MLVFFTLLVMAAAAVVVKALNRSTSNSQIARDKITAMALAQAKDALIGFAITYGDTHSGQVHGYLPCPDMDGKNMNLPAEGVADPVCGNQDVSVIGRLPWRTLDLAPLRGGDGECLWYAVSGTYKNSPKTGLMNWDTNGLLQVYASEGTTLLTPPDNQAVAVIFAPGNALSSQNRTPADNLICGGNYTATNYLDTEGAFNNAVVSGVANAISQFRLGAATSPTSDRMIFITRQEIWDALQRRNNFLSTLDVMTQKTAECIASFGAHNQVGGIPDATNKSLPWPAALSLADYTDNTKYNDINGRYVGRAPYRVNNSRLSTGNSISNPAYLLQADGANCPAGWDSIYPWWDNWKEQVFYAISQNFVPSSLATSSCGNCLSVNGSTAKYAAVVMFSGRKLTSQTRTDKSVVADYLEGRNAVNIANSLSSGSEDYQVDATSATFNDILYCIKQDLTVVKGDPALTPACP